MSRYLLAVAYAIFGTLFGVFVIGPAESAAGLQLSLVRWEIVALAVAVSWAGVDWLLGKSNRRIPVLVLVTAAITLGLLTLVNVEPLAKALALMGIGVIPAAMCVRGYLGDFPKTFLRLATPHQ